MSASLVGSEMCIRDSHTVDNKINYKETTTEKLSNDLYDAFLESKNKYKAIDIVVENNGLKTVLNSIDIKQ